MADNGCLGFDALKMASENLGETLHLRQSWRDLWFGGIRRAEYGMGVGLVKTSFEIGRSEPTEEQTWVALGTTSGDDFTGSCGVTYNSAEIGFVQKNYKPAVFGLHGPKICQDDLAIHHNAVDFWGKYIPALEEHNAKAIMHRRRNVYMEYVQKNSCDSSYTALAGDITTQPPALTGVSLAGATEPTSDITQEYLDTTASELIDANAMGPDSNGLINLGPLGPEFLLLIGAEASKRIWLNNSELRQDARDAFTGREMMSPLLKRIGATTVIGNFRHVVTIEPPRWRYANGTFTRVNKWTMSSGSATKGSIAILNTNYTNPNYANVEGAIVLSPNVYTEQPLRPVNTAPGMKWNVQNYMGEWDFVTGFDALNGFTDCTTIPQDPKHKWGRHIAEYRAAWEPVFPDHGRLILFSRCPKTYTQVTCS